MQAQLALTHKRLIKGIEGLQQIVLYCGKEGQTYLKERLKGKTDIEIRSYLLDIVSSIATESLQEICKNIGEAEVKETAIKNTVAPETPEADEDEEMWLLGG